MSNQLKFDYYYGDESSQFSFYKIPRQLITDKKFKRLSTDAKLLYGLLLDRMSLSAKNGWFDDQGRVFIYYPLEEIQEDLNCGHDKATKMLVELDSGKTGIGLIERIRQGQGKPTKIYVKRFTTCAVPPQPPVPQEIPRLPFFSGQECGKAAAQSAEKPQSRVRGSRSLECEKTAGSYIKYNYTDSSYTDPSINPSSPLSVPDTGWIDRYDCQREIEENIGYADLCRKHSAEDVNEIVELMVDVLFTTRSVVRIGGEDIPAEQIRNRFLRLENEHLEYVFECLSRNTTEVRNIRGYLLATLYNAPLTINSHYRAAVQHDFAS